MVLSRNLTPYHQLQSSRMTSLFHIRLIVLLTVIMVGVRLSIILCQYYLVAFDNLHDVSETADAIIKATPRDNFVSKIRSKSPHSCTRLSSTPRVFYISQVHTGGANKYIDDLKRHFTGYGIKFYKLENKAAATQAQDKFRPHDILLFQYLLYTDFTYDDVINLVQRHTLRLIVPIHDRYFISSVDYSGGIALHSEASSQLKDYKYNFLKLAEHIIFPSAYIYNELRPHIDLSSMTVVPHIDQKIYRYMDIPELQQQRNGIASINIGIITRANTIKGFDLFRPLFNKYCTHQNISIHFNYYSDYDNSAAGFPSHVLKRGGYQECDIYSILEKDNIHGLIFLNNYPETYSYALTKGINSGLPILYTNIGAVKERMEIEMLHAPAGKYVATNNSDLNDKFEDLLKFIMDHAGVHEENRPSVKLNTSVVAVPTFYDRLFFPNNASLVMDCVAADYAFFEKEFSQIHRWIQPYAVYSPQFDPIPENGAPFPPAGYTDMANLMVAKADDHTLLTPLKHVLGFYDLVRDRDTIPRQIQLAKSYGLAGFGIYCPWFNIDSMTGRHMVFQHAIDKFFQEPLENFSVFFIYCNENCTTSMAFQTYGAKYDRNSILANMESFSKYAVHPNYRKIDNRPILFVHHADKIKEDDLQKLKEVGDDLMQKHGFDGIELVIDIRGGRKHPEYPFYYTHANYDSPRVSAFGDDLATPRQLDYHQYVEDFLPQEIYHGDNATAVNSVFINFDKFVRFRMHENSSLGGVGDKASFGTRSKNKDVNLFKHFLDFQFDKYRQKKEPISRLFLINAWNEWGEQMALEPSNEEGFLYLEVFRKRLLSNFASGNFKNPSTDQ